MTTTLPEPAATRADGGSADEVPADEVRAGSLRPVLAVIPAHCRERDAGRSTRLVLRSVAVHVVILAALLVASAWWIVVPLLALAGLSVASLFVLGHDAAHGALYDDPARNRRVGRLLMIPSLHVYESWVVGHNRIHHGHTLRQGMDFVWHPLTVEQYRELGRLARVRHRLEWSALGAGAYYLREVWWNKMMRFTPPERSRARIEQDLRFLRIAAAGATLVAAALGFVVSGSALGALAAVAKLVIVPFLLFTWTIGFTVHVHHIAPEIKWWPRRTWTSFHGQVEGTTILRIPAIANLFLHDIFVHVPHHVDVRIPCYHLEEAALAIKAAYPEVVDRRLRLRDYLRNTRECKLYDFEQQRWLRYDAVHAAG